MRPKAISIIVAFLFAATAIAAVVGVAVLFPGTLLDRLWELNRAGAAAFRAVGRISGALLLLLGAGTFAAGLGMLRGRRWTWWFAVVLFAIDGVGDVVALAVTGEWARSAVGIAVCCTFLYLLSGSGVRRYFRKG
jgi:uncharacterized membrane protein (DUF2068 family)